VNIISFLFSLSSKENTNELWIPEPSEIEIEMYQRRSKLI